MANKLPPETKFGLRKFWSRSRLHKTMNHHLTPRAWKCMCYAILLEKRRRPS